MEKLPFHEYRNLPAKPGVYVVFAESLALYVGSSRNLKRRMNSHHKRRLMFQLGANVIQFELCNIKDLASLEMKTIYEYKPSLNGLVGRPLKEDDCSKGNKGSITIELPNDENNMLIKLQNALAEKAGVNFVSKGSTIRFLIRHFPIEKLIEISDKIYR
jgi:hypothetical protein